MPEIIIGRDWVDLEKFGDRGTIVIGKNIVGTGFETHVTTPIKMDILRPHIITIVGKRGSGKSYTSMVIAEEIAKLPEEIKKNLCIVTIDTQGIFWTMKYPNNKQRDLLYEWNIKPQGFDVLEYIPIGQVDKFEEAEIPYDKTFSFNPTELTISDWCYALGLEENELEGILISKVLGKLSGEYTIDDIIDKIREEKFDEKIKLKVENMISNAKNWGIFSNKGIDIYEFLQPGKIIILDVSLFSGGFGWNIRSLVVGLVMKKIYEARVLARKEEEFKAIEEEQKIRKIPLCWIITDEAHNFIPSEGRTAATDIILTIIRQGRQPGISQVFITQMPDKLHSDVLSQTDLIIAHRLTSQKDINALKAIMQTYMLHDIAKYLDELPKLKGTAIILDDNSERLYKVQIRPRQSWHGGESPIAL